jgi:hypothetical protein
MKIYSTDDVGTGYLQTLLYGLAGSGKTPLAATLPAPIIISTEPGLKSLRRYKLPYVAATTSDEALDAVKWVAGSAEARQFQSVFFDSISALSETILVERKRKSNDPRKFSPETTALTMETVMRVLAIQNKHVVMTCKATQERDPLTQQLRVEPFAVVPKLGPLLPYHFSEVLYISRHRNQQDGSEYAMLTCGANDLCTARDRNGSLALYEPPDLTHIIQKTGGRM